jgi:hypothetical protein
VELFSGAWPVLSTKGREQAPFLARIACVRFHGNLSPG